MCSGDSCSGFDDISDNKELELCRGHAFAYKAASYEQRKTY